LVRSSQVTVEATKIPTSISILLDKAEVHVGEAVTVYGSLYGGGTKETQGPLAGKVVHIYRRVDSGAFSEIAAPTTNSEGKYSHADTITAAGTYTYYAEFLGDTTYEGCESPTAEASTVEKPAPPAVPWAVIIPVGVVAVAGIGLAAWYLKRKEERV
jgi:hypothetical protein